MKRKALRFIALFFGIGACYFLLLIYPNPLFAFAISHDNFRIYSDRPIPTDIHIVMEDVRQRLEKSELYASNHPFNIYLCNDDWRFRFFTRNQNAGGVVNYFFSPHIFIRENEIEKKLLIPPSTWKNPLTDRPLSYFIAHEATHSLQRQYDKYLIFTAPVAIIEGYAEYIGKSTTGDLNKLKEDYINHSPAMSPKNGLYDLYHLYVRYLMEQRGYTFARIVREQPDLEKTLVESIKN